MSDPIPHTARMAKWHPDHLAACCYCHEIDARIAALEADRATLLNAAQRAADTFADFAQTLMAARTAEKYLRDIIANVI